MKTIVKVAAIAVAALVVFTAIFLTLGVTFEFKSWEVVADNGVFLSVNYSTNKSVTVTLIGPDNNVADSAVFSAGDCNGRLGMAPGENAPAAGTYVITVEYLGRKVYENYFDFIGPRLSIGGDVPITWGRKDNLSTIENISIMLVNSGDLPIYVNRVSVSGHPTWVGAVQSWIMPGSENFSWNWSEPALQPWSFVSGPINVESMSENLVPPTFSPIFWGVIVPPVEEEPAGGNADTLTGTVTTSGGWHAISTWGSTAQSQ